MKILRRTTLVAVTAAAALTLVACSSSSDDSATTEASATASEVASEVATEESAMASAEAEAPMSAGTIVDVAAGTEGFGTVLAAVEAAGLTETLKGAGPFTVFAPTDEAFAALPAGLVDALLLPENKDALTKVLTYHVVPGQVLAADITDGDVATVEGQNVTLSTADGVTVNGAKVIQADVMADNGVIHVIDAVIVPPDVDVNALLAQ